jgi:hypothetical protein
MHLDLSDEEAAALIREHGDGAGVGHKDGQKGKFGDMPRVVPSQIVTLIDAFHHDNPPSRTGGLTTGNLGFLAAVLQLTSELPDLSGFLSETACCALDGMSDAVQP